MRLEIFALICFIIYSLAFRPFYVTLKVVKALSFAVNLLGLYFIQMAH